MKESTLNSLIAEAALKCGDPYFEDFEKDIYIKGLKRANRKIAKKYHIPTKILQFTLRDYTADLETDVLLDIEDLKEEFLVNVNGVDLAKKSDQLSSKDKFCYYLELREGELNFNYVLGGYIEADINITNQDITDVMNSGLDEKPQSSQNYGKSLNDEITILYTSVPAMDSEISDFLIPDKYEEEQMREVLLYMAELGIVKFKNEKEKRYRKLRDLNTRNSDYQIEETDPREWITVKPFIF